MVPEVEPVELLVLGVPVGPDPLKNACSVVEAVRHDRDLGLTDRYELAVEIGPRAVGRGTALQLGGPDQLLHHRPLLSRSRQRPRPADRTPRADLVPAL